LSPESPILKRSSGSSLTLYEDTVPAFAIRAEGLSKQYNIGRRQEPYRTLRESLAGAVTAPFRRFDRKKNPVIQNSIWALKDVNFRINCGDVVGIIGRNGAGKSTLLKILSRITAPTEGEVAVRGRIASLLEVGTGFHPELTGRENIFLNGAILGMTRAEVRRRFDEMVAFAEVDRFIDTPVKHYSSGMYMRLAFAIAAHLETDILLVDEVLAVGDADFQKKCLSKMDEVSKREGRTVLFVSHNLAAVAELTRRGIVIDAGSILIDGTVSQALSAYLSRDSNQAVYIRPSKKVSDARHVMRAEVITSEPNGRHQFGEPLQIKFWISHDEPIVKACFSFQIVNEIGQPAVHAWAYYPDTRFAAEKGTTMLICQFPSLRLNVGSFSLRTYLTEPPLGASFERLEGICPFEVIRTDRNPLWGWRSEACVYHEQWRWQVETCDQPGLNTSTK
jgi:lipopolysaccharide transport system ATP-binding protein